MSPKNSLRAGYLSSLENAAQSLGTLAPSLTIGIGLPVILGMSGHASTSLMGFVLVLFLGIGAGIYVFATRCSSAGSLGAYTAMGLGPRAGVVASWFYIVAMAFVAISAGVCGQFCVSLLMDQWVGPSSGPWRALLVPTLITSAAWYCAHRDVRLSVKIMLAAEFTSLFLLVGITVIAMAKGSWWDPRQLDFRHTSWDGIRVAFITAATTLAGFESATTLGEEVTDARKTVPRTLLLCLVPTGILYLLMTYSLGLLEDRYHVHLEVSAMPFDTLAHSIGVPILGTVSLIGITVSSFAASLAGINAGSRVLFDLSRQSQLPAKLGEVDPVHATPGWSIGLLGFAGIAVPVVLFYAGVAVTDAINYTIQVASYGYMGSYVLVCLAALAFVLREKPVHKWIAFATFAGFLSVSVILGMSVIPLPEAPWGFIAFVSFAVPLAGSAWSEFCGRRASRV